MGRVRRLDVGQKVYHVLNRAIYRSRLFQAEGHYERPPPSPHYFLDKA